MNISAITKHYDKLSARERFALLQAAIGRDDNADCTALASSAPRKTWSVPTTRGLSEAFDLAAMWHVMTLHSLEAAYYLCLAIMADDFMDNARAKKVGNEAAEGIPVILLKASIEFAAWRELCKEYGVDHERMLDGLPSAEGLAMFERMVNHVVAELDADTLARNVDDMRGVIESLRKQWE